jgi:phosphohistidine phosphatase
VPQELWFLRHGDAESGDGMDDRVRRLTGKGERQSVAAGKALARLRITLSACYTSPRVRARDTARLACEPLEVGIVEVDELSGGFDRDDAIELLSAHDADARVLVVGHEPDFSQTVHDLTGARIDLKKGGVAVVRVERGSGELLRLLAPRELKAIAS